MTDSLQSMPFIDLEAQRNRISAEIETALNRVLSHGQYIMGPEIRELEAALTEFCGARHCITCANGTDALSLAMMAEGIGPGDAIFVPAFTFVATAEAVALQRATPVFVDVDDVSFNMSPASLERAIGEAKKLALTPRAIIAVDLFGQPADYPAIQEIADAHGLVVIADAAQSFGAKRNGGSVGTLATYTTTSFFPAKPLGCYGDGGAVFTDDADKAETLMSLRMHGSGRDRYENVRIGLNSRLDSIQAAVLLEKLKIFPDEIEARNRIAVVYHSELADHVLTPQLANSTVCTWAQYTVIPPEGSDRAAIRHKLEAVGVPTAIHYPIPLHRQAGYLDCPADSEGLPVSEQLSRSVFSLPMHPYLTDNQIGHVVEALTGALKS